MSATADVFRQSLWPLSFVWSVVTAGRNFAYDAGILRTHRLDVPVVAVGNLTVGGTGKTPLVAWMVRRARDLGRRPGVLARGYGRARGAALNDEGMLLAGRFPDLPQVQDPDRYAGGARLVREHDVDLVILDDGFQHRRLRRDRDIVCMDARRPFAQNRLLPAGDLREPRSGLRRASLVVLTRAEGLSGDEIEARREAIHRAARREVPMCLATHAPARIREMPEGLTRPPESLSGQRVHLLSSIARPGSFEATVNDLGAEVAQHTVRRDHHRHTREELLAVARVAERDGAALVTTEKDAVKLAEFDMPYLVLEIDLKFLGREPMAEELGLS